MEREEGGWLEVGRWIWVGLDVWLPQLKDVRKREQKENDELLLKFHTLDILKRKKINNLVSMFTLYTLITIT